MDTDNPNMRLKDGWDRVVRATSAKDNSAAAYTEAIIGAAFEVLNSLGPGLHEKPYENALVVEFGMRGIPFAQQRSYDVMYKNIKVGEYRPDLIAFDAIVIDTKVIDHINDHDLGQMLNYLKITGHPLGLILNFKRARLEWKRVVYGLSQ